MSNHTHGLTTSDLLATAEDDGCAWCIGYRNGYLDKPSSSDVLASDPEYQLGVDCGAADRSDDDHARSVR